MNLQQIIIGRAPDFILKSGQTIYHHKVVLEITPTGKPTYKMTMDHVSMHELIRGVKEVLEVIGWGLEDPLNWNEKIEFVGSVTAKCGVAVIKYRLPDSLLVRNRQFLDSCFYGNFRTK
jgi:hypothetical protein